MSAKKEYDPVMMGAMKAALKTPIKFDAKLMKEHSKERMQAMAELDPATLGKMLGEEYDPADFSKDIGVIGRGVEIADAVIKTLEEQHELHPITPQDYINFLRALTVAMSANPGMLISMTQMSFGTELQTLMQMVMLTKSLSGDTADMPQQPKK